ncbi:phosphoinositide phospholipase C 6-like isoform X1 [Phalaenopsis equestris]|uniref:phosphoinositide phospholipase C 6-like isoform X1 n=1 Tax=Phalaenopsis equestris TaxID=78828 RepID=UPI0009E24C8D|nr:phosphoinositide phospholipase C 6-like isoform X1 [Phalaenopsis equestris]
MGSYKYCCCFTRKFRWDEADPPADLKAAFDALADERGQIGPEQLRRFLNEMQGDDDVEQVIEKILQQPHRRQSGKVSRQIFVLQDLYHYLFSDELNPPIQSQVHQDMSAPLSHYFIYTGHNSYLTGNQLSSDCSDVPIIKALQRGVRVIELDMWPNSTKDNVDILHGRTLTSPVDLLKCLKSIKEYAFVASPYPVVITLEDHLTPHLQAKVAEMVIETFGEMLYYPNSETHEVFPSPESLKRRIILSTKPPKEYLETLSSKKEKEYQNRSISIEEDDWGELPDMKAQIESYEHEDDKSDQDAADDDLAAEDDDEHKIRQAPAPEYKHLITIRAGKPKGSLKDALKVDSNTVRRLSLSEQELAKAAASHGPDLVRFTQRNMLRIYPKGTRVTSSNYNPLIGWMHGAQMVAFNMQGYGRSLWLMHGFYKANGGCGFVKKPDFMLQDGPHGEVFNPRANLPIKKTLKVKVYLGDGWRLDFKQTHFDAYSPPDFYTKVGIAGVPADCITKKTKTVEDNWAPVWDEEFTFALRVPELALLRIEVHEYDMSEKDDFGGQTCLPVCELRPGIRAVPLFDRKGMKFKSVKLLTLIEFI